ncbi:MULTISPECIES: GNAT family N-acetyltransferase [unclassified Streptomyces]|uniref:GNAT family N-acetyltransferase n=1 Tax=unclassified Streptomyces TaxID=2593676 RepID=UPI0037FBDD00
MAESMRTEIVPFESGFVAQAANLLAETHTHVGTGTGALDLADADVARRLVAQWQGTGPAVAAVRDGALTGFMAAGLPCTPGEQWARVRLPQHACARSQDRRATYRSLYAALSGQLVSIGAYEHALEVSADDHDTISCFVELSFGIDHIRGFRPVARPEAPAGPPRGTRLRTARAGDLDRMFDLAVELQRFHAGPPALRPAPPDLRPIRDSLRAALSDEGQLLLVAEEEEHGHLTGLIQAAPDTHYLGAATIGIAAVTARSRSTGVGTALVAAAEKWAAGRGFATYGTNWSSANQVSDAFWRGRGMIPAQFKLRRLIDSRVVWADARLSYGQGAP